MKVKELIKSLKKMPQNMNLGDIPIDVEKVIIVSISYLKDE